jgi:hypothetical protein
LISLTIFYNVLTFVVGYLGFNSISRRREAVRKLYGMSLYLSGEAALKSIEDKIRGLERDMLAGGMNPRTDAGAGRTFLLSSDYRILNPEIPRKDEAPFSCSDGADGRAGISSWAEAEKAEFQKRIFGRPRNSMEKRLRLQPRTGAGPWPGWPGAGAGSRSGIIRGLLRISMNWPPSTGG